MLFSKRTSQQEKQASKSRDVSLAGRFISFAIALPSTLIFSIIFSVIVEWVGMNFVWEDQGVNHSKAVFLSEANYVNRHFRESIMGSGPAIVAAKSVNWVDRNVFVPLGVYEFKQRNLDGSTFWELVVSAYYMIKVVIVRCCVLMFSIPAYVLFGVVGLVTGLVQRDLRRFGCGRESSDRFELSRKLVMPCLGICFVLYLSWPDSINPAIIIVPFAAGFGFALHLTVSNYKKYL